MQSTAGTKRSSAGWLLVRPLEQRLGVQSPRDQPGGEVGRMTFIPDASCPRTAKTASVVSRAEGTRLELH
jgi:hypothetical protein